MASGVTQQSRGYMRDIASDAVEMQGTISRKHVMTRGQFNPGPTVDKLAASSVGSWNRTPRYRQGTAPQVPVGA
jgi:hypothetical protein